MILLLPLKKAVSSYPDWKIFQESFRKGPGDTPVFNRLTSRGFWYIKICRFIEKEGIRIDLLETLPAIFLSSFVIALSGALMPGPVLTVTISESVKRGFWAGPQVVLGHGILEVFLLGLLVAGFVWWINEPLFLGLVGVIGGGFLLWMSLGMLREVRGLTLDLSAGRGFSGGPVTAGIVTSLSNPYWILWWATIGLGYVLVSMKWGVAGLIVFFAGHILADLLWYSVVSLLVSRGRRYINLRVYRGVVATCAFVLMAFGLYFGASGITYLL
jgi:threonine/homoserine/homoserine lactone efflux protein